MVLPLPLRSDFFAADLRLIARSSKDATQARGLLAFAAIYDGATRREAARIASVTVQIIRDWVVRFNAEGLAGLINRKAPGYAPKLNAEQRKELCRLVQRGPIPGVDGVVRWRLKDLAWWVYQEYRISIDESTLGRMFRKMGYAKLSARPRPHAQTSFWPRILKTFPEEIEGIRAGLSPGTEIVLWQDEARIGQKNKITRRWAKRGTRPSAPHDQRTSWVYIFGAICPEKGKGAGLIMPYCDTKAMNQHLSEISEEVDPGAHAVLVIDQAGWHSTPKLIIPGNITLLFLPPRSPELNPVENIRQFMRDNWLSNRVFDSCGDIVALSCEAWNKLLDHPWRIMSIGMRHLADGRS